MENEVKFVRLKNGDDLISEVVENYKEADKFDMGYHYYTLINPLKVMYLPNMKTGSLSLAFAHWVSPLLSPEQEFMIQVTEVLTMSDTSERMVENYTSSLETAAKDAEEDETASNDSGFDFSNNLPMDDATLEAVKEFLQEAKELERQELDKKDKGRKGH